MQNPNPGSPLGPLSVGNVVNAGVRIYRAHFMQYLSASLVACLWLFVPVYGWAKWSAIHGTIARHAFQELIDQPESLDASRSRANSRMWGFMGVGFISAMISTGIWIAIFIGLFLLILVIGLIVGIVFASLGSTPRASDPIFIAIAVLFYALIIVVGLGVFIRVYSRIFLAEVPYVMENAVDEAGSVSRSWALTKGSVGRIQWIVVVAFLISLVVNLPSQIISFLPIIAAAFWRDASSDLLFLLQVINWVWSILATVVLIPFWQTIKAVIYYDLRARREGLGLKLRDRE